MNGPPSDLVTSRQGAVAAGARRRALAERVELKAVHALTPRAAAASRRRGAHDSGRSPGARLYRGTVAYDDPVVRSSLARLTGGMEYRGLRISAYVGRDGSSTGC